MAVKERREREYARRHQLIIDTARRLAEAEGWTAVTTRRLAETIEYSQPVLYSHFTGKEAIVGAVAVEGFGELAAALRQARAEAEEPVTALRRVAHAYTGFALTHPTLYEAMFLLPTDLAFGQPETPEALTSAYQELYAVVVAALDDPAPDMCTEVMWSALHGLVSLFRSGRLKVGEHHERLDLLLDRFTQRG
ncbi:TetR/AcrR family transcriptional regulator [Streptomyces sp. NPDC057638]|uniref:TetR/AcrR family transcriptional regulator n=1 Tax=Streptomyces sp. NPDC057638 TaxID=3346190 RepID=UPI0036C60903